MDINNSKHKNQNLKIKNIKNPIVAIIGRPNVGKSTLFNRLIGKRKAIEFEEPGTTRDRIYEEVNWRGETFILVDSAGIRVNVNGERLNLINQIETVMDEADVILFVVDAKEGLTTRDREAAEKIRKKDKKVILVINKVDNINRTLDFFEFYKLGIKDPISVSAISGSGSGELLDGIIKYIKKIKKFSIEKEEKIYAKIAILGRPNVGKSTFANYILGQQRSLVSETPGTTRDSVHSRIEVSGKNYLLIDTAGIRRKGKIRKGVEKFSIIRALRSIFEADISYLLLDAEEGIVSQDAKIAGFVKDVGCGLIICINKIDKINFNQRWQKLFITQLQDKLAFVSWAPVIFISARFGTNVDKIYNLIDKIIKERNKKIPEKILSEILLKAVKKNPPIAIAGQGLPKIYSLVQENIIPPTFTFKVSKPSLIHFSYRRYLENQIRKIYGFIGTPIKLRIIKY